MKLHSDTCLQRISGLTFDFDSSNRVRVSIAGRRFTCGDHGLAILDAFSQPRRLSEALDQLRGRGRKDWMDLSTTVLQMFRAGILWDVSRPGPQQDSYRSGYGAAAIHIRMVSDRQRTEKFITGIRRMVRPGDVVVDIGTGSGILAVAAAQAGAARVYAVEASGIAEVAQEVFAANKVADRITLIRGWSTQIELPERADLLVSEMIGDEPFGERILEITWDARRRLLKTDARLLPSRIRVFALPVTIPPSHLIGKKLDADALERWQAWYGQDLSPLAKIFQPEQKPLFYIRPQEARNWPMLADPILLAEFDLENCEAQIVDQTSAGRATQAGPLNGALIYFETQLGSATLSTHPHEAQDDNHWRSPVWWFKETRMLRADDTIAFRYQCPFHQGATLSLIDASSHSPNDHR
jgi:protein arginine N-methyltransferase 1